MGWIQDLLTEFPLSAVLKERIKLIEERYEERIKLMEERYALVSKENEANKKRIAALEREVAEARIPANSDLEPDTERVLVYLFKAYQQQEQRDVGNTARALGMEAGLLV